MTVCVAMFAQSFAEIGPNGRRCTYDVCKYNVSRFRVQILVSPPSLTEMKVKVRVMQAASYRGRRRNCRERKDNLDSWISRFSRPSL